MEPENQKAQYETHHRETSGWAHGVQWTGRAIRDGVVGASRFVKRSYRAIEPDLLRHFIHMPVLGLTHLSPRIRAVEPIEDDGHRPVVFVHGLGGHPGNFAPMSMCFRVLGRRRLYSVGFQNGHLIEDLAAELGEQIERIAEVNQLGSNGQVDLVCHSMGGICARVALENDATRKRVAKLVTLGTPHSGTELARLARTHNILDLRPGSELVKRLDKQLPWATDRSMPQAAAIWSKSDYFMLPAKVASLSGAENIVMPGMTHLSYLLHLQAWVSVWTFLNDEPVEAIPVHAIA